MQLSSSPSGAPWASPCRLTAVVATFSTAVWITSVRAASQVDVHITEADSLLNASTDGRIELMCAPAGASPLDETDVTSPPNLLLRRTLSILEAVIQSHFLVFNNYSLEPRNQDIDEAYHEAVECWKPVDFTEYISANWNSSRNLSEVVRRRMFVYVGSHDAYHLNEAVAHFQQRIDAIEPVAAGIPSFLLRCNGQSVARPLARRQ